MEQQQQYHQYYQIQTTAAATATDTNTTTQPYDPSQSSTQIQSYDPQSYYSSYPQQQQPPPPPPQQHYPTLDYSNQTVYPNYYPDYSNSYDPNSIHPPGVADPQQAHSFYYPATHSQVYYQPSQPVYGGGGSQGGRSTRGRGRGKSGRHGKGRGGGVHATSQTSALAGTITVEAAPNKPAPEMAWCELCRVDCNTLEILEKHKNGKKHQRNVKVFEELQTMTKPITVVNPQNSITQPKVEGSDGNLFQTEHVASASSVMVNNAEAVQESADTTVPYLSELSGGRGGFKRKMRGGRGGRWIRAPDGSRRLAEPPKPKQQMVPILCELCNVKCESQIVYNSHVAGKKHLSTLKRYQGHKETFGEGVEALYPTIPNLPSIPITPQTHQQVPQDAQAYQHIPQDVQAYRHIPQDAQALASMILSQQNVPDPQATQAAVAELLTQHGIHDAQTLIVQLIPYLLTQPQLPGSALGTNASLPPSEGPPVGQNGETNTKQQNLSGDVGTEAVAGTSNKPDEGSSEAGKVNVKAE